MAKSAKFDEFAAIARNALSAPRDADDLKRLLELRAKTRSAFESSRHDWERWLETFGTKRFEHLFGRVPRVQLGLANPAIEALWPALVAAAPQRTEAIGKRAPKPPNERGRSQPRFTAPARRIVPGRAIVRFKPGAIAVASRAPRATAMSSARSRLGANVAQPLEMLRESFGLVRVVPVFADTPVRRRLSRLRPGRDAHAAAVMSSAVGAADPAVSGVNIFEFDPLQDVEKLVRTLRDNPAVALAEPMPARWLTATKSQADPMKNLQWGLRAIRWFTADRPTKFSRHVAVLDTGIDTGHPDLAGAIADYHHAGVKADDLIGHGTHVAGIVAAIANNGVGIAGVAECKVEMWKIFSDEKDGDDYYVDGELFLRALGEARRSDIGVLNMSIGGTEHSKQEAALIKRLIDGGVAVVAAMGNEYEEGNPVEYPGAYPGVIAVGAVDETMNRASFSNTGKHIAIAAPGDNILSTLPRKAFPPERDEKNYASWSGTSMAAPHVSALLAMTIAKNPDYSVAQASAKITRTANKVPAMKGKKRTNALGAGVIDVEAALK
jgi:hypothetical protein